MPLPLPLQVRLLVEGEELTDLLRLPPEQILLRWINFHLAASGAGKRVSNFGTDLQDGEAYILMLSQINPAACPLSLLELSVEERNQAIVASAKAIGIPSA